MNKRLPADPFGLLAAASVGLLLVLVIAAGAVAVVAQSVRTWRSLFLMEQTMAMLVPSAKILVAITFVAVIGLLIRRR